METAKHQSTLHSVTNDLSLYEWHGLAEALDQALEAIATVASLSDTFSEIDAARWTLAHASALRLRFDRDGSTDDISQAREKLEALADADDLEPFLRVSALYHLGRVEHTIWDVYGDVESISKARQFYSQALELLGPPPENASFSLWDEVGLYRDRTFVVSFQLGTKGDSLDHVTTRLEEIVERIPEEHGAKALALVSLATAFRMLGMSTRNSACLSRSEELASQAMALSQGGPAESIILSEVLAGLGRRFMSEGDATLGRKAGSISQEAVVRLTQKPHLRTIDRALLMNCSTIFSVLSSLNDILTNLEKSAESLRLAVSGLPADKYGPFLGRIRMSLCVGVLNLAEETGDVKLADEAIAAGYAALPHVSEGDDLVTCTIYFTLGGGYSLRYNLIGEDEDHEKAFHFLMLAVEHAKSPLHATEAHGYLSTIFVERFKLHERVADLETALNHINQVSLAEVAAYIKPQYLSMQGELLLLRYEISEEANDLTTSLRCLEAAVDGSPNMKHLLVGRYARALRRKYDSSRDPQDLERCMSVISQALNTDEHLSYVHITQYCTELAAVHHVRFLSLNEPGDLTSALQNYRRAWEATTGPIVDRLRCAITAAELAYEASQFADSASAYDAAVSFLPRLTWLGFSTRSRQKRLKYATGQLASNAAAVYIMTGRLERAVELLDEGRSVVWRSVLELRTDVQGLQDVNPEVAAELLQIGSQLDQDEAPISNKSPGHEEERAQRRQRLAERWDELIGQVRALPGFEAFLLPATFETLRAAAEDGPIVAINVSEYRTDAMIITATEPLVQIPLPDLPSSIVSKLAYTLQQALQTAKDARGVQFLEGVLLGVCRRLWFGGLGTIAAYLQDHGERQGLDEPFRVWWMPTGMLSMLPIHCAGPYDQTLGGLYELFISSYTTTLSALLQGRVAATPPASPVKPFSVLAVAQPQALGAPYLRYAEAEVQGLATSQLANYVTILSGDSATISQFEAELPEHEWLHCCCHARWDPTSPLDSAFRLRDGNFSLGSIIHMRLKKAQFAFLSACHTARHSTILPDESMHLAAGMQIAGFRGVLATQWGMVDKDGPALVELFYGCLAEAGFPPDPRNAAEALHWSLQQLRERGMPMFRWALFVHIGI